MKSFHARGIALALAGCALVSVAQAQSGPYGGSTSYGPMSGPEFYQPPGQPIIGPATGEPSSPHYVAPSAPQYVAPSAPRANHTPEPAYGSGVQPQSPAWMTGSRLQEQPAREMPTGYGPVPHYEALPQGKPPTPHAGPEWQGGAWSLKDGGCDVGACPTGGPVWFGSIGGLIMTRDNENDVWLSYDTVDVTNRVLTSRDAGMDWAGGFETRFGRYFNCGANAIEAVYWGVYPNVREANALWSDVAGDLNTILHFDQVEYDAGQGLGPQPVSDFYFQAERHRLLRSYQFHNVEVNLLSFCTTPCTGPRFGWTAGVRYFRFDEGFQYATDPSDVFLNGDPNEVAYTINVVNHLVGAQLGGRLDYLLWNRFNLYADTKVGLYGNNIRHRSQISGSNGDAVINDPGGPHDASIFCIDSRKNDIAMIGELNLGTIYQLTNCWSINAGYRAVAISGLALSTNQIPVDYIADLGSIRNIDSNGSMILHGAYAGLQYNW